MQGKEPWYPLYRGLGVPKHTLKVHFVKVSSQPRTLNYALTRWCHKITKHTHTFRTRLTLLNIQIQRSFPVSFCFGKLYTKCPVIFMSFLCLCYVSCYVIFPFGAPSVSTGKKVSMFSNIWGTVSMESYNFC